jgi:hypothetical protein
LEKPGSVDGHLWKLLMARHEADREDLFTEAAGLVRKLEGHFDGSATVLAGFRADGVLVVYFDADPMFQLDESGRLRRSYVDGCLYRAQGDTLARLTRLRSDAETRLMRSDLSTEDLAEFRSRLLGWIEPLAAALREGRFTVTRRNPPEDASLEAKIAARLDRACTISDWIAPALRGKR